MSKLPFWSLRFGYFCHFSPKLKPFASGSLWFQHYCHFGPKVNPCRICLRKSCYFAQDFVDPDVHHRHISHLFGLFPGHTITLEETPELFKAAEVTLNNRGGSWMVNTTWKAASWARLHNSERAYQMIKHLFDLVDPENESNYEGGLYSNMFTAHPPFQIDANFGFSAAVAEMLIQSSVTDIYLIPALPRDKWRNGSVEGLKARGNVTVSISWSDGDLHELRLWSDDRENQRFTKTIHYNDMSVVATMLTGKVYTFDGKLRTVKTASL
ncbi:putative alpha-L-fucosidase [Helianthus anomalus]